jgi:hypothetical protein
MQKENKNVNTSKQLEAIFSSLVSNLRRFKCREENKSKENIEDSFRALSNTEKGMPLEAVIREYCISNELEYGIDYMDLTNVRNFKGRKGTHELDFLVINVAAIEAKNWDCYGGKGYVIAIKDIDNQIIPKFSSYPRYAIKIVVISNPNWYKGAKEYLLQKGIHVIELAFVVTDDRETKDKAYEIIKAEMDKIINPSSVSINVNNSMVECYATI